MFAISNIIIQAAINTLRADVMAALSAAYNVEVFAYYIFRSFSQACTTFTVQNYGAKQYKLRVQYGLRSHRMIPARIRNIFNARDTYRNRRLRSAYFLDFPRLSRIQHFQSDSYSIPYKSVRHGGAYDYCWAYLPPHQKAFACRKNSSFRRTFRLINNVNIY